MKSLALEFQEITKDYCHKYESNDAQGRGGQCRPVRTVMEVLGTENPAELREKIKDEARRGLLANFLGTDTDWEQGTAPWTRLFVPIGGPLEGYQNRWARPPPLLPY